MAEYSYKNDEDDQMEIGQKEYEILPDIWNEVEAVYWHPETKEDEDRMWEYVRWLEQEEHCNVKVYVKERIL